MNNLLQFLRRLAPRVGASGARPTRKKPPLKVPVTAGLAGALVVLIVWEVMVAVKRSRIEGLTELAAASVVSDFKADMSARVRGLVRFAELWDPRTTPQRAEFAARLEFSSRPGYEAIEWVDPSLHAGSMVRAKGNGAVQEVNAVPEECLRAVSGPARSETRGTTAGGRAPLAPTAGPESAPKGAEAIFTHSIALPQWGRGFAVCVPIIRGGQFGGLVVGIFNTSELFDDMYADHAGLGYTVEVFDGEERIYQSVDAARQPRKKWSREAEVHLPGIAWKIRVRPTSGMLAAMKSPPSEAVALIAGLLLAAVLAGAIYQGEVTRLQALAIESTNQQLHREVRVREHAEQALRQARDELETRVQERTTDLIQANEALQAEVRERAQVEEALQQLSRRLLNVQDEERRRIARELHDATAQALAALSINLAMLLKIDGQLGPPVQKALAECANLSEECLQQIRSLSYLLHPPSLDDLGLVPAVRSFAEGIARRTGIRVAVDVPSGIDRPAPLVEGALFRVVQESLTNVYRHSHSPTAKIRLFRNNTDIVLEVEDEGTGICPEALNRTGGASTLGVGIAGMQIRLKQLGGRLEIDSNSHGTTVRAVLPLAPALEW